MGHRGRLLAIFACFSSSNELVDRRLVTFTAGVLLRDLLLRRSGCERADLAWRRETKLDRERDDRSRRDDLFPDNC